jgi:hypothetical protein
MAYNGDTDKEFPVGHEMIRGIGSFHKTLPHNEFGEVCREAFITLVEACAGDGGGFAAVPRGSGDAAQLTNPQAGLAADRLTHHPASYSMPPAPQVLSITTAAEMTELYWMALLRDVPFSEFHCTDDVTEAANELDKCFREAIEQTSGAGHLKVGIDVPGSSVAMETISSQNLFRLGLPAETLGPLLSQFFVRPVPFGTQTINAMQRPYRSKVNFLTEFSDWLHAQQSGKDRHGQAYPNANEYSEEFFESEERYISTMRDLARFVNKDALHQAYFNAALILLSGGAKWTPGNPYGDCGILKPREAGFGVLGGPHILALVSEVATRALKVVWNQKWQVNLRLRPEAYGCLVHVQTCGKDGTKRSYGLPDWVIETKAAQKIFGIYQGYLLPMAFTPGSPTHPAYGAGHATVAGACVTVLKAYFKTFETVQGVDCPVCFNTLKERHNPWGKGEPIKSYVTGLNEGKWQRIPLDKKVADDLTIEGELNKLAQNVAMGRSMGGVHWRTDNSRSLVLGEALAAEILAEITLDTNENEYFEFRTFARRADGQPKKVRIQRGRIYVDGVLTDTHTSAL